MPIRVLIVDDHPSFRSTARALLEAEGFEVVGEAVDGASAVDAAATLDPELVLLDVQLPDTDGFAVAAQLRDRQPSLAIVLTSSRDSSDYGRLIDVCGAQGFIPKAELSGDAICALLRPAA